MTPRARALVVGLFFLAAFLHANLWGAIIPLWQIPDEAAHYEYVRLLVKLGRPPTPADADPELQAQMLRSMWENRYWEYLGFRRPEQPPKRILPGGWTSGGAIPDTAVIDDAYVYAFSQLQNSTPAYYAMLAPVQALVVHWPIDDQLRALRLASRVIFALGVVFIVLTAGEVMGWRIWPVLGAGAFAVLQPMFVYIGSGVNNDNGVMLFASAAAWQLAAGWRRGYPWRRVALIAALIALAVLAKRTGVFLVAWAPLVLGAWWLRRRAPATRRRVLLAAGALGVSVLALAGALYFVPGPVPANWRSAARWEPAWTQEAARDGGRAFRLRAGAEPSAAWVRTTVRRPVGLADGAMLTLEGWALGRAAVRLDDDVGNTVRVSLEAAGWQPLRATMPLDPRATRLTVWLMAGAPGQTALFDGLALRAGDLQLPLPNPSAEMARPVLAELLLAVAEPLGAYGQMVRFVNDYRANLAAFGERLPTAIAFVQQSFWGKFGIFARAANPTIHMGWVTLLAMGVGAAFALAARDVIARRPDPDAAALLALWGVGLGLLVAQTFAPLLSFAAEGTWLPQGRYLFGGMAVLSLMVAPLSRNCLFALSCALILITLWIMTFAQTARFF
ncbi:hypothetical protein [Candidatus Roseilinea sp. NK_OTU-006]|jgi:hypothetical protein|uniref:hypothetical protein n=1 Tax=Candidatus Roseilinea sp. NK_OTU-006 TaxID=2704250 RepID=UPI00145E0ED6|nr:hypothetical protein [Candidatus Roseilinea sp. NK_OTU-006]